MRVLTRKVIEAICIGKDIEIVVTAVRGNQVRIGINAPRDVTVDLIDRSLAEVRVMAALSPQLQHLSIG